jgi:hypothetical protein
MSSETGSPGVSASRFRSETVGLIVLVVVYHHNVATLDSLVVYHRSAATLDSLVVYHRSVATFLTLLGVLRLDTVRSRREYCVLGQML